MKNSEISHPYVPPALLEALYKTVFERIQVEEGWAEQVRALSARGSVLYVLPNLNWLDFLALDYLVKRYELPPLRYTNDLGLWLLNPEGPNLRGRGLWNMLLPNRRENPEELLRDAIEKGGSAALFLKRPPSVLDWARGASGNRGLREGDDLVHALFRMQRQHETNLVVLPLVFVWSKAPKTLSSTPLDFVFGSSAWPTPARALSQFAYNARHASLRFAEPVDLADFLAQHEDQSDPILVRRLTYMVLRRLERERRSVVGPAVKPPERVRTEILRSPKLQSIITDLAGPSVSAQAEKRAEAASMLEELSARPSSDVIKGMGVLLEWGFNRIYRGIEYDPADIERVREAQRDGALILLPSHKSHIDYLVLSYFFYERNLPLPLIAAGDNLNFKPVGPIFRRAGAFFIRRSFKGDRLYAAVVDAYIRRIIKDGRSIEVFLEGGRSRTGKLLEPKFGLLNMIVDGALGVPQQNTYFVPVSIGYERVVEAEGYQRELSGGEKKKEEAADLLSASEVLRHRYGRINLHFGSILSVEDVCADLGIQRADLERPAKRRALVTRLGNRVMDEINRVTAVTPGSLTAMVLLTDHHRGISEGEVLVRSARLLGLLRRLASRISAATILPDGSLRHASIREALSMFVDAGLLDVTTPPSGDTSDRIYSVVESKRLQLDTSKNIIVHFLLERALVAVSLERDAGGYVERTPIESVRARVLWASKLFKHEFRFRADAPFDEIFDATIDAMVAEGHLEKVGADVAPGPGENGSGGEEWLAFYRSVLAPSFEAYLVAAHASERLLAEALTDKEFVKLCLTLGNELYLAGTTSHRESISKPLFENATHALVELGYLTSRSGKLEVKEPYQTSRALEEIRSLIAPYLSGRHDRP